MAAAPISVILPHYNRSHLIATALDSIRSQTLQPMEIIIVDDASQPGHREALQKFSSIARLVFLEKNVGPGRARNAGVDAAKGDYLAFLDDDDVWFPNKLQMQWEILQSDPSLHGVAAPMTIRYDNGPEGVLRSHATEIISLPAALAGTPALLQTLLVRTEAIRLLGGFESSFKMLSDREFWVRFTAAGYRAYYMDTPVARLDRRAISRFTSDEARCMKLHLCIVDKHAALYDQTLGRGSARLERSRILRRHGAMFGGVRGRLLYLQGCVMAAEWKHVLHLFTTGRMLEVPHAQV